MVYFGQNSLKDGGKTYYLTHLDRKSGLRPRISVNLTHGSRKHRGVFSTTPKPLKTSKHRDFYCIKTSKYRRFGLGGTSR